MTIALTLKLHSLQEFSPFEMLRQKVPDKEMVMKNLHKNFPELEMLQSLSRNVISVNVQNYIFQVRFLLEKSGLKENS